MPGMASLLLVSRCMTCSCPYCCQLVQTRRREAEDSGGAYQVVMVYR